MDDSDISDSVFSNPSSSASQLPSSSAQSDDSLPNEPLPRHLDGFDLGLFHANSPSSSEGLFVSDGDSATEDGGSLSIASPGSGPPDLLDFDGPENGEDSDLNDEDLFGGFEPDIEGGNRYGAPAFPPASGQPDPWLERRSLNLRRLRELGAMDWEREPFAPARSQLDQLVRVELEEQEAARHSRRESRRRRRSEASAQPRDGPAIIDLTEEPDSPVEAFRPQPQPRHPRRQLSPGGRTPSLARSDGSILGPNTPAPQVHVIDLTEDSPEPEGQRPRLGHHHNNNNAGAGATQANNRPHVQPRGAGAAAGRDQRSSPEVTFMGIFARLNELNGGLNTLLQLLPHRRMTHVHLPDHDLEIIGQAPLVQPPPPPPPNAALANPLLGNPVQFNYQANGFGGRRGEAPKPAHVPPPAAREGFTRNTGEDVVAVCASCEEELKYDPEMVDGAPPAKRARSRKEREEHHFWAVPECGHVYCKHCFDNRREVLKRESKLDSVRFQVSGKTVRCAVSDCRSDVTNKRSWIGIFL